MKFYDLSLPLSTNTPEWPGDNKFERTERQTSAIVSRLILSSHFGTHIDAPKHFLFNKLAIDKIPLKKFIGKFKVVAVNSKNLIDVDDFRRAKIGKGDKILFKTRNSNFVAQKNFTANYVSLSLETGKFLAKKKINLVGIDYFGIEAKSAPGHPVHKALLSAGIIIVEGLNLKAIKPGIYQGAILPLRIAGGDGSPARAVLWK